MIWSTYNPFMIMKGSQTINHTIIGAVFFTDGNHFNLPGKLDVKKWQEATVKYDDFN